MSQGMNSSRDDTLIFEWIALGL